MVSEFLNPLVGPFVATVENLGKFSDFTLRTHIRVLDQMVAHLATLCVALDKDLPLMDRIPV